MTEKSRLDGILVARGMAESRHKARALILAGLIEVDGVPVEKAGRLISNSARVSLRGQPPAYVSRGGGKLEAALRHFDIPIQGRILLDVGASTGGFTDCLLAHGARKVVAVDVGYGQLAWKLRQDTRVQVMERTNIRYLTPADLQEQMDGGVVDVSFISLKQVIPPVSRLLKPDAFLIVLIKPQFEVGRGQVGKGGVVRDPTQHRAVLQDLTCFFDASGWSVQGVLPSPVLGPKGNQEFLACLTRGRLGLFAPGDACESESGIQCPGPTP